MIFSDSFQDGLGHWLVEAEAPGRVACEAGRLVIDMPAGCTVWLRKQLPGPLIIEYEARVVSAGGSNDRVSDLNCFWMANDPRSPEGFFAKPRSGRFADYNQLLTYYVGLGGNGNTTTRFRRYIGDPQIRPLRPEDDRSDATSLIVPNAWQKIRLVANGSSIQFWRDGRLLFDFTDPRPYRSGFFGFRTVKNHMEIRNFRVYPAGGEAK